MATGRATALAGTATKFKRFRSTLFDEHHVLPMFMGGVEDGNKFLLPPGLHAEYHDMLRKELKGLGLHSDNWGQDKWVAWLRDNPDRFDAAAAALFNATSKFDGKYGTDLMKRLLNEMKLQGWGF